MTGLIPHLRRSIHLKTESDGPQRSNDILL